MLRDGRRNGQQAVGAAGGPAFEGALGGGVEWRQRVEKTGILRPAVAEIGEPGNPRQRAGQSGGQMRRVGVRGGIESVGLPPPRGAEAADEREGQPSHAVIGHEQRAAQKRHQAALPFAPAFAAAPPGPPGP